MLPRRNKDACEHVHFAVEIAVVEVQGQPPLCVICFTVSPLVSGVAMRATSKKEAYNVVEVLCFDGESLAVEARSGARL